MGQSNDLPRRETFNLNIAVNNDNFYCVEMLSSEIVLPDNSIQIYPGEKLFIEKVNDPTPKMAVGKRLRILKGMLSVRLQD